MSTIKQLSEVKTLYKAKLDPELEKIIKHSHPHLLEEPKKISDWKPEIIMLWLPDKEKRQQSWKSASIS